MDLSDVRNIEFLDLSDVDENEQIRVRTSLQQYDASVQLPWIKFDKKKAFPGETQTQQKSNTNRNDFHHPMISPTLVNNVYHQDHMYRQQQTMVMPPIMGGYFTQPSSTVFYSALSPVSPPFPQPVYIPQTSSVHNYSHPPSYSYTDTVPAHQTLPEETKAHFENGFLDPVQEDENSGNDMNSKITLLDENNAQDCSTTTPSNINSQQISKTNIETSPITTVSSQFVGNSPSILNGVNSVSNSSPANKSWASLFNSQKSNSGTICHKNRDGTEKAPFDQTVNKESNNSVTICPIKNPRRSQFVDPDCYRMGEYLMSYSLDGKAVSLQPRGLLNQSNYCYINSILQALIACPPMYNLMSGLSQNISSNEKRKPTPVIDGMCRFIKEFNQLAAHLRVTNRRSDVKNTKKEQGVMINTDIPFEPSWIYKMLNGIRSDLIEGRQEDAEEFLGCLLNGLNDEMLELIKLVKNDCDEPPEAPITAEKCLDKEWQVMGPKNKGSVTRRTDFDRTPISDIFGGLLKSRIHRTGDHITENIQPFFTLQLNIEKVKTVREALEALVTKYQLEGVTSSKTNEEVEAWQQVMLDELPAVLVLHLKCFDFKLDGCTKIIKALEFPIDLKIDSKLLSTKTQAPREKQYKLFAVVYHDGKEASKGHYITDAFHVGYSCWLRYDDASVKTVQEEHVLKPLGTRVPYLLFYRRSDTIRSK